MSDTEIKCKKCNGLEVKKRGYRKTMNRGKIQRYECKRCKYAFVNDDGFFRMRNDPEKVIL